MVVIGHEDTIGAVSKPRLLAAGADMERIWFLESTEPELVGPFTVPADVPELNRLLDVVPNTLDEVGGTPSTLRQKVDPPR